MWQGSFGKAVAAFAMVSGLCSGALAQAPVSQAAPAPAPPPTPAAQVPLSQLPAEAFGKLPFISQPRLSPDGTAVGGMLGVQGKQVIAIVDLFAQQAKPVYAVVPEDTQASWIRWTNSDNLLVGLYALQDVGATKRWSISRVISINRKTGKISKVLWSALGQSASDVVWVANDGSPNVEIAAQNSIYLDEDFWPAVWRVNVETGKSVMVVKGRGGVLNWYADATGRARAGFSYDDSNYRQTLLYRGEGDGSAFRVIDRASIKKRESLMSPFAFLPGSDHALALHDDAQGLSQIYEIDLNTGQDLRTVYQAPASSEVDGVILAKDRVTLLGATYTGASHGTEWFDPTLAVVQKDLDKSVGTRRAQIVSMSDDRNRLLVLVDRPNAPGSLYFFDINSSQMQRFANINEALATRSLSEVRVVKYTARDGLPIEAVLTLPHDRAQKNLPVVILPHGGPWAQDTPDYDYWAQFIASRGYAVLQPNFRGSTGYGTDFLRAGEGEMGKKMQDDLSDGLAWLAKEGIADPHRACIAGGSYGGYAAMWGIVKDPDQYRCAISIAGVSNVRAEVNDFGEYVMGSSYREDWKRMAPDFAAVSPLKQVSQIKAAASDPRQARHHGRFQPIAEYVQCDARGGKNG